jgi:hypothetical protein
VVPIKFDECNIVIAKDQPEYLPLPSHVGREITTSCWKLSWRERFYLLFSGKLWLQQMNFGRALQPQRPSVEKPFIGDLI